MKDIINGKWEPLGKTHKIFVTKEHTFNTDTILLSHFSAPKHKDSCADFGTGCGTIPFIWHMRFKPNKIKAIELQELAYNQAKISINENKIENIKLIHGNINDYKKHFAPGSLDLISCNPPYKAKGAGLKNETINLRLARHEDELSIEELAKAARYALKFGGRLCICQRPERLADIMCIFKEHKLEPKKLRLVQQRADKAPFLFLLECKSGANMGLVIEPTLLIEENGKMSSEMLEIYGEYKND